MSLLLPSPPSLHLPEASHGAEDHAKKKSFNGDLRERHSQMGSLAGAAHLLKDNAGVLR